MALSLLPSVPTFSSSFIARHRQSTFNRSNPNNLNVLPAASKCTVAVANVSDQKIVRRSGNYHPSIWDYDYIQSLNSHYQGESFKEEANRLVGEVRMMMLQKVMDPLEKLELIDTLQRLGLSYHFRDETNTILEEIRADQSNHLWRKSNLYATALEFRLQRQNGYKVPQDVFSSFLDETGNFKASLCEDCKGLLNLYEASYLSVEGEGILDAAKDFSAKHLQQYLKEKDLDEYTRMILEHTLELPLHWRVSRLEARWFIDVYELKRDQQRYCILLQLAKLDFNIVQAVHQDDLRYASKWWMDTGLGEKLTFSRDRLMENFLWTVGVVFDPQFGNIRRTLTKVNALITTIDDVYDVYGTLDELQLFTQVVERWDINAVELLPEYMKTCFLALYNSINEMGFDNRKEDGFHSITIIPFLKKAWAEICKAYLQEAKWYYSGHIPTFKEYIDNAWISISAPLILSQAFSITNSTTNEFLEDWNKHSTIIYCSSMILRLADDLGTSVDELKRGDVSKSIQCHMYETGSSEVEAREYVKKLIDATWKKINEEYLVAHHSPFIEIALNLARMAQCMYQYGDGHGVADKETKHRVLLLLVSSLPYLHAN